MYELTDYMNPKPVENEDFLELKKDELLLALARLGVSNPSELSRELALHIESVNKILAYHSKIGFISRVKPDKYVPQSIFRARIPELQQMSINSFEKVALRSWWTITVAGIEYLKEKYKGTGKKIIKSLVTYHRLKILDDMETERFK